jgi:hypothetical protein
VNAIVSYSFKEVLNLMELNKVIYSFNIPIELPTSVEKCRNWIEAEVEKAQKRISMFASNNNWEKYVSTSLIKKIRICETKKQFDREVRLAFNLEPETTIPKTYSAVIANDVLLAVTPETYAENYPDGQEGQAYEKLIAHELAHALHIRILEGKEEEMGPRWFYEGFAILAAGQFDNTSFEMTKETMREIIKSDKAVSYVYYRLIMNEILHHIDLEDAVTSARIPNFEFKI